MLTVSTGPKSNFINSDESNLLAENEMQGVDNSRTAQQDAEKSILVSNHYMTLTMLLSLQVTITRLPDQLQEIQLQIFPQHQVGIQTKVLTGVTESFRIWSKMQVNRLVDFL